MISLSLGYPDFENELQMVMETGAGSRAGQLSPVISREDFLAMQEQIHSVYLKQEVAEYLLRLIRETRSHPLVDSGASPRAAGALAKMTKASAWFQVRRPAPSDSESGGQKKTGRGRCCRGGNSEKNQASASGGAAPIYKIFRRRFCINML